MARDTKFLIFIVLGLIVLGGQHIAYGQPALGDTANFSFFDFHFFQMYDTTQFTLRGIGDYCYVWVQDSQWARGRFVDSTGAVTDSIVNADSIRVDTDDIEAIIEAFEEKTPPADSTAEGYLNDRRGIYEIMTELYGEPPDIDGDPKIYILVMNCTELIGAAAMTGYFDPVNQLDRRDDIHSNEHEIIYLDCDPFDPSSDFGLGSIAQQFTHMLQYGNDQGEECWVTEGLSYFNQFLCGYGVANKGHIYSRNFLTVYFQSTLTNCREEPESQDQVKTAMFMQYLFEQYGLEVMKTLALDTENTGIEAVNAALAANGFGDVDFDSLFFDEQLAWFLDEPKEEFFGGKYSFKYYESGAMLDAKTYTTWGKLDDAPYFYPGNQWSMDWILVNPPAPCITDTSLACFKDTLVFKGDIDHNFRVIGIKANLPWQLAFDADKFVSMEFLELDDRNRTILDVSKYDVSESDTTYSMVILAVMHKDSKNGSPTRTRFVVDNDLTPPANLLVAVIQNPMADRFLNIFVACDESLFVNSYTDARPLLEFIHDGERNTLTDIQRFATFTGDASSEWENYIIYNKEYILTGKEGSFQIAASGWDIAGNPAPSDQIGGSAKVVSGIKGATLTTEDERAALTVPPGAFDKETFVTLLPVRSLPEGMGTAKERFFTSIGFHSSKRSDEVSVGPAYLFGPGGRKLNQRAKLTLRYIDEECEGLDELSLAIHRLEGSQWVNVESKIDPDRNEITAWVDQLGQFQIHADPGTKTGRVPETYALFQNYPNPFNPVTEIRYHLPFIHDAEQHEVTLRVYNVLGQEMWTLVQKVQEPGEYIVRWNGRDSEGHVVPSGIYFYRLTSGDFIATKKMILLK